MQESRYNGDLVQNVFTGKSMEEIEAAMDKALRDGEEVIRRRELSQAEFSSFNRHQRRKMAVIERRAKGRTR